MLIHYMLSGGIYDSIVAICKHFRDFPRPVQFLDNNRKRTSIGATDLINLLVDIKDNAAIYFAIGQKMHFGNIQLVIGL